MSDADTVKSINSFLLFRSKINTFKRKIGVIPVLRHIFEAVDIVLDFFWLEFGYLYDFLFFCFDNFRVVSIVYFIDDNRLGLCLNQNWRLFKYAL